MLWNHEFITAFLLGLIGGVIPGPVLTAIFTEILQNGLMRSFRIIFIAMLTETMVAVFSLIIVITLGFDESIFRILSFVGAAILIWISISIWKVRQLDTGERVHFGFWKIIAMILANGVLWSYWITICIPKAMLLGESISHGEYLFMILVQLGWLLSTSVAAILFAQFRNILSRPNVVPVVFKLFALVFIYFAADMTIKSVLFFTGR